MQSRGCDLSGLVLEQIDSAGHLSRVDPQLRQRRAVGAPSLDRVGDRGPQRPVAAERVEEIALAALVEQSLLIVLTVDLDEWPDFVGKPRCRRGDVVQPGRRPPASRDLAADDESLGQSIEQRLDSGDLCAVADKAGVGACTGDEAERVDQQALPGARLAGDHVEARFESQPQAIDQREVGDGQLEQASTTRLVPGVHDGSSATLWRSRSQNGCAPSGSTRRIGRSNARTSTTSPTAIGMSSRPSTETSASWASTTVQ